MNPDQSRYLRAARRTNLNRPGGTKVARAAVAGAMLVLPAACGSADEATFETAETTTTVGDTASAAAESTTTLAEATTASPEAITTGFPSGAELLVSFNYAPSETDRAKRPYVAVWVEDQDGNLVQTISIWYQQDQKGTKWLDELTQWYQAAGGVDDTRSTATQVAGEYTVAWDGTDTSGNAVAPGEYTLNIESSREHGPHSFTTTPMTVSGDGFSIQLADDGELSGASAELRV